MKILKRLVLLIGFIPAFMIAFIRWILTGKDIIEFVESFIAWCID